MLAKPVFYYLGGTIADLFGSAFSRFANRRISSSVPYLLIAGACRYERMMMVYATKSLHIYCHLIWMKLIIRYQTITLSQTLVLEAKEPSLR
jgi:hypothetical protein